MQRAPADLRVVILDSCASGAFTRHKGGTKRPPFLMDSSIDMRGHAFLTSTSADEQAQESDRIAASYFTYYLLSGLRGAADANQDRRVTLQEAYQFASQETLARTERTQGGPQHAAYEFDLTGTGDMVVTDVRGTESGLILPPELCGRITVRQRDGALIAELHKAAGSTLELGVEPGDYVVAMEGAPQIFQAEIALVAGQRTAVRASAFHAGGAARADGLAGRRRAGARGVSPRPWRVHRRRRRRRFRSRPCYFQGTATATSMSMGSRSGSSPTARAGCTGSSSRSGTRRSTSSCAAFSCRSASTPSAATCTAVRSPSARTS